MRRNLARAWVKKKIILNFFLERPYKEVRVVVERRYVKSTMKSLLEAEIVILAAHLATRMLLIWKYCHEGLPIRWQTVATVRSEPSLAELAVHGFLCVPH